MGVQRLTLVSYKLWPSFVLSESHTNLLILSNFLRFVDGKFGREQGYCSLFLCQSQAGESEGDLTHQRRVPGPAGGVPSPEKRPQRLRLRSFQWEGRDGFLFYVEKVHDV